MPLNMENIKGTISDPKFQTSLFFRTPRFYFAFSERTSLYYLYNNSLGNSMFLEKETITFWWELIIAGEN